MNDTDLLQAFLRKHSQEAFQALVVRHSPLVQGIAWRVTGDSAAVEDIAMRVFAVLAKKAASLEGQAALGSWLVVTTRLEALRWRRSEQRRGKTLERYRESLKLNSEENTAGALFHGEEIDSALAALSEKDRQVLLLRYYEDLGYPEIGQLLGRGEDAARKRCQAALVRMSAVLAKLAAVSTTTGLGVALANHFSKPEKDHLAAKSLAASAWEHASTSAGGYSLGSLGLTFLAITSSWIAGWGVSKIWPETMSTPPLPHSSAKTPATAFKAAWNANTQLASEFSLIGKSVPEIGQELVRRYDSLLAFLRKELPTEPPHWSALVEMLPREQIPQIIDWLDANCSGNRKRKTTITNALVGHWGETEAEATCRYAVERWKNGHWELDVLRGMLWSPLTKWSGQDPEAALRWLQAHNFPSATLSSLERNVLDGMAETKPKQLLSVLSQLPKPQLHQLLRGLSLPDSFMTATLEEAATLPDALLRSKLATIASLPESLEKQQELFGKLQLGKTDAGWHFIRKALSHGKKENQPAALKWAWQQAPVEARPVLFKERILPWLAQDPTSANAWLQEQELDLATLQKQAARLDPPRHD